MAITSWTSEGMDWTDVHNKRLYPYIEALRLAVNERYLCKYGISERVPAVTANGLLLHTKAAAIDSAISDLLGGSGYFLNPSTCDGAQIPTYLTESVALAILGETRKKLTISAIAAGSRFNAVALKQCYNLVNLMRYRPVTVDGTSGHTRNYSHLTSDPWVDVVSDLHTNYPLTAEVVSNGTFGTRVTRDYVDDDDAQGNISGGRGKYICSGFQTTWSKVVTLYVQMDKAFGSGVSRPRVFSTFGQSSLVYGEWSVLETSGTLSAATTTWTSTDEQGSTDNPDTSYWEGPPTGFDWIGWRLLAYAHTSIDFDFRTW